MFVYVISPSFGCRIFEDYRALVIYFQFFENSFIVFVEIFIHFKWATPQKSTERIKTQKWCQFLHIDTWIDVQKLQKEEHLLFVNFSSFNWIFCIFSVNDLEIYAILLTTVYGSILVILQECI